MNSREEHLDNLLKLSGTSLEEVMKLPHGKMWAKIIMNSSFPVTDNDVFTLHNEEKALQITDEGRKLINDLNYQFKKDFEKFWGQTPE